MSPGALLIRAEASAQIGWGHVMRCLALAHTWQDRGGKCMFATADLLPSLEGRLHSEKISVALIGASPGGEDDAKQLAELARQKNARWIVVDGYQFGVDYQRVLKNAGHRVLAVDDYACIGTHVADIVLDQNAGASENLYANTALGSKLLLGSRYAVLRREFKRWRNWKRETPPTAKKMLITMGGSDPQNLTLRAIQTLNSIHAEGIEAIVVVGSNNPHIQELNELARNARHRIQIETDPLNMAELMAWADVAISSAGSTCWEMCMMGLPAIIIEVAENQRPIAQELNARGICLRIPLAEANSGNIAAKLEPLLSSMERRKQMSSGGQKLIDGHGAERLIAAMQIEEFTLRRASFGDSRLLWQWANDPLVRQASFSPGPISWHEHEEWFAQKISDPSCLLLIFEDATGPVAVVRTDANGRADAEISITIAPGYRGHGLASALLDRSLETIFNTTSAERVHAFIKPTNLPSSRSFANAGFILLGSSRVRGCDALHYLRERQQKSGSEYREHAREVVPC